MFYYSYLVNENSKKPTVDDYKMLYNRLPVDDEAIWGQDRYHAARINKFLVPTEFNIILYANLPLTEKNLIDALNFDCGSIINGNISANEFDRIVETIRTFETRRNLYLMNAHANGRAITEYRHNNNLNSFDITNNNRMNIFSSNGVKETAKPNYKVSESFLKEFFGFDYETYITAKNNNPDKIVYNFDLNTNVSTKEEWNIKITNWINRNIYELANLGFYATNFPDIIFFKSNFANSTDFADGEVHKSIENNNVGLSSIFKLFKKS